MPRVQVRRVYLPPEHYMNYYSTDQPHCDIFCRIAHPLCFGIFIFAIVFTFHLIAHVHVTEKSTSHRKLRMRDPMLFLQENKTQEMINHISNWTCLLDNTLANESISRIELSKKPICPQDEEKETFYLTLFTTMYASPSKFFIFNNTLHVWAKLQPFVNPVLFMTPKDIAQAPDLVSTACSLGWNVYAAPLCNREGYPVLKSMYEVVIEV